MPALKNLMRTFARYATTAAVANLCPSTMRHGSVETMQPATGWLPMLLMALLVLIAILLGLYTARHYLFTLNRLFARQRSLYADIEASQWPRLTVFIAAHNEEAVVGDCIASLLAADYPRDRLVIMPVNDRSTDGTRAIIERCCDANPGRLRPFHRESCPPGKAAALKDATDIVIRENLADVILIFDADYLPGRKLLKELVVPFLDPEIGAVMGRVVPQNAGVNLLTRLLDLERSGGYQVDQQARFNLGAVAQYGGTVGGVRLSALDDVGGWHDGVLAEDTDLTYRLLMCGWRVAYLAHAECYEEVPQSWPVRFRQIGRWAKGHNQALARYAGGVAGSRAMNPMAHWDGLALLGVYAMAPVMLLGWMLSIIVVLTAGLSSGQLVPIGLLAFMGLAACSCLGNFAAFFEVAAAVHLDGNRARIRLLPLLFASFLVSMVSLSKAAIDGLVLDRLLRRQFTWDKTVRYRPIGQDAAQRLNHGT